MMSLEVSVVIPIFGNVHSDRLWATIDSIALQEGVNVEIIISEQAKVSQLEDLQRYPDIKHVLSKPPLIDGVEVYNAGVARNIGLKQAKAPHVYFNDADIIFFHKNYLSHLLSEVREKEVLMRPDMWRMLQGEVPEFLNMHKEKGIEYALSKIIFRDNFHATLSSTSPHRLELVTFNNRVFSSTPEILEQYKKDATLQGQENFLWQRIVHCGGMFGRREYFEAVGGYASDFPVCAYEDSDLQWKLSEMFTVRQMNGTRQHEVLHLDHELHYRSPRQEGDNLAIFVARKNNGFLQSLQRDLAGYRELAV